MFRRAADGRGADVLPWLPPRNHTVPPSSPIHTRPVGGPLFVARLSILRLVLIKVVDYVWFCFKLCSLGRASVRVRVAELLPVYSMNDTFTHSLGSSEPPSSNTLRPPEVAQTCRRGQVKCNECSHLASKKLLEHINQKIHNFLIWVKNGMTIQSINVLDLSSKLEPLCRRGQGELNEWYKRVGAKYLQSQKNPENSQCTMEKVCFVNNE